MLCSSRHLLCMLCLQYEKRRIYQLDFLQPIVFLQEYFVEIYEWSGTRWEPYVANDVQVQFYMMSPYVLKTLSTNEKVIISQPLGFLYWMLLSCLLHILPGKLPLQGLYHTSFKVPDVYGVFQFKIEYQRLGYSSLSLSKQVSQQSYCGKVLMLISGKAIAVRFIL